MPFRCLYPLKAWRQQSSKYGKVINNNLTDWHWSPPLDNLQSISPFHHWSEEPGTDWPSQSICDTCDTPLLLPLSDLSVSVTVCCLLMTEHLDCHQRKCHFIPRESPPVRIWQHYSVTLHCTHLSHPILSPCWYLIPLGLDTTPRPHPPHQLLCT